MGRIRYGNAEAAAFQATRHLAGDGLGAWREAVERHLRPRPRLRLLDLGSGTGMWAAAFTDWYGIEVVAVEPSAAMRARSSHPTMCAGQASAIPLGTASMDGVWLSTVIHHIPDLQLAAVELGRVLRPGAPVLIRSAFPGRHQRITLFRFFAEALTVLDTYPTVEQVRTTFAAAGFDYVTLEAVPQVTTASLQAVADKLRRNAHTPLKLITDAAYAVGRARLRAAARVETGPVIDTLDLLVLRRRGMARRAGHPASVST